MSRTMAMIAKRYDDVRNRILARIHAGQVSASMSGIEYYPKPWGELDITDDGDLNLISVALAWDDETETRTHHAELRKLTADELELNRKLHALFREPCGPEREAKIAALRATPQEQSR